MAVANGHGRGHGRGHGQWSWPWPWTTAMAMASGRGHVNSPLQICQPKEKMSQAFFVTASVFERYANLDEIHAVIYSVLPD